MTTATEPRPATAPSRPAAVAVTPRPAPPPRGLAPRQALGLIGVGAVLVVALWWHDTPYISSWGSWLTNAGRVTGLLAGYSVAVLLTLMARVPALERGVGADRLARWHSMGGRYTVGLSSAHFLLIVWGYAVTAHTDVVRETGTLWTSYADVLMASVAWALLLMVGVVSMRAARRKLRYETWYYLHLYTYLAVALAFSHQFATGADFVTNLAARVLWAGMYVGVGVLLLWFRVGTPVYQAFRHRMRVAEVRPEGDGIVSVLITGRHLDELAAQPGQFFRWRFLTRSSWWSSNPYSLSAVPHPRVLRITVKEFGDHSGLLRRLHPGTRVLAEGPYGALTSARRTRRKVLLLAGGVGITPLRSLFESLPGRPGDVTLVYRTTTEDEVIMRRELDAIAAARGSRVHYLHGSRHDRAGDPLQPQSLTRLLPDLREHDVFLCGPPGMTRAATRSLRRAGVPRRHIHVEAFEF